MLEAKDFAVFEDGREESVSFFGTTDVPFDLVLLIDLSASTSTIALMVEPLPDE
jgi:hypothetical protein